MEVIGLNEIRESYLRFFEEKGHLRLESSSLVPKDDKSLLLINAGMAPLKPYFTGLKIPPSKRVTTCQKCIRTGDIENVGKTSRHGTFFEMLGNFSFGDYFKNEIIPWSWEYVTEVLKIPKDKLYVTIYLDDDEAYDIWVKSTDIEASRIFRLGKKDNFWEHGLGPCGPCSEIHYDRGEGVILTSEEFTKAGDEDRVVEFWNLVFTQFDKNDKGEYVPLSKPNIDTGMGLERIATIMQGVDSIFEVDTIKNILNKVSLAAGVTYGENEKTTISLRIITDHVRSVTFMIGDGILPSNEGRGYVLRRLLRRASRHGRLLGIKKLFLYELCEVVINQSCSTYSELKEKEEYIKKVIKLEEERFDETIDLGIEILQEYVNQLLNESKTILSGDKAFKLYDTYGFPLELTEEILEEKGLTVDMESFDIEMKTQRERARAARDESNFMGSASTILNKIPSDINTYFEGYEGLESNSKILLIIENEEFASELKEGSKCIIITEKTPFYAEMGGQVGDTGVIFNESFTARVINCKKNIAGKIIHIVEVISGTALIGDSIVIKVDSDRRDNICKNHTCTHMLHEALKEVLGDHVHQSGSYVDDERLRFDFTHFSAMSENEIKRAESIVNTNIMKAYKVSTKIMSIEEAKKSGAIALFDDKYKEEVRVVSVGDFSVELCGGTHVKNSGEIGLIKITSESGVAAGVRRIEALTGFNVLGHLEKEKEVLNQVGTILKCSEKDIILKLQNVTLELKDKDKMIFELKDKLASGEEAELIKNSIEVKGIKLVSGVLKDIDGESLRNLADKIRDKIVEGVVVLGSSYENRAYFIAMASKNAVAKGVHCGKIIKEVAAVAGGGGGGRPDMAQAGGKLPEAVGDAILIVSSIMESLVK